MKTEMKTATILLLVAFIAVAGATDCDAPKKADGSTHDNVKDKYSAGESVTFSCTDVNKHEGVGNAKITCKAGNKWAPEHNFKCVAKVNMAGLNVKCFPKVEITLDKETVEAFAKKENLRLGNVKHCGEKPSGAPDATCAGAKTGDGTWSWTLNDPNKCNAKITYDTNQAKKVTYEYKINRELTVGGSVIRRKMCGCIVVKCEFDTNADFVISNHLTVTEKKLVMTGKVATGEYLMTLQFTDSTYAQALTETKVDINSDLYVLGEVNAAGSTFSSYKVSLYNCIASDKATRGDAGAKEYNLINDKGCVKKEAYDEANSKSVVANKAKQAKFTFKSFVWQTLTKENQKIYVHCKAMVCLDSVNDCTSKMVGDQSQCSGKVKRSPSSIESSATPDEHSVSLGPVVVKRSTSEVQYASNSAFLACSLNNGGCSELCVNTYGSGHVCACMPGRVLNDDGVSCMDKVSLASAQAPADDNSVVVVASVAVIAILNILGVIAIVMRRGKNLPVAV